MRGGTYTRVLVCLSAGIFAGSAHGQVISMYGDADGFGFGAPEVDGGMFLAMGGTFFSDYRSPGEIASGSFTDRWDGLTGLGINWSHSYDPTGATGATLRLYIAGFADIGSVTLTMDGAPLTTFDFAGQFQTSHILDVAVPVSALDGSTSFAFTGPGGDGYIMDYARLTVVPAPASAAVVAIGLAGLRRRR